MTKMGIQLLLIGMGILYPHFTNAQTLPRTIFFISPYICCGAIDTNISKFYPSDYSGVEWNATNCNKDGPLGTHIVGTILTHDDPINDGKVCSFDASPLMTDLPSGLYDIATITIWNGSRGIRKTWGSHRSEYFPLGGFIPNTDCILPSIFLTRVETTTGHPNSKTRISFQLATPDNITEVAVQLNDIDINLVSGSKLNDMGAIWFTQPALGSYTVGVRAKSLDNCQTISHWQTLLISK
jgi:hypothetical protein